MKTKLTLLAVALLFLVACGGSMSVRVRGVTPMNVNEKGESTPVDVRIYQLKDDQRFKEARWEELWEKPDEILGDTKLDEKTDTVFPGKAGEDAKVIQLGELKSDCRFIGIMALYQLQGEAEGPRHVVVPADEADDYIFEFAQYKITMKQ